MRKNETFCDVLLKKRKKKRKQTLESAQYALGIKGICVRAVILSWYLLLKGEVMLVFGKVLCPCSVYEVQTRKCLP